MQANRDLFFFCFTFTSFYDFILSAWWALFTSVLASLWNLELNVCFQGLCRELDEELYPSKITSWAIGIALMCGKKILLEGANNYLSTRYKCRGITTHCFVSARQSIADCYLAPAEPAPKAGSPTAGYNNSISRGRPRKGFFFQLNHHLKLNMRL